MMLEKDDVRYAGFWKRVAAYIIDFLVLLVPVVIFSVVFVTAILLVDGGQSDKESLIAAEILAEGVANLISFFIGWVYYAAMESSNKQATLGKMALGIKVTNLQGEKESFGQASGRYFGKILSGLVLLIGYLMVAFTGKKQGLHDMLAGTLVVNKN